MSKVVFGGPMFQPSEDEFRRSVFDKKGGHYNIFRIKEEDNGIDFLRAMFPEGVANEYNIVLFSTSGVHGYYRTIEDIEDSLRTYGKNPTFLDDEEGPRPDDYTSPYLTFLFIQPRLVSMTYGNLLVSLEDIPFLKRLRGSSCKVVVEGIDYE